MASESAPILAVADWDSECFGFPVARIAESASRPGHISTALARARAQGIQLVYWSGSKPDLVPDDVLQRFDGRLVDRKATFQRDLGPKDLTAPRMPADLQVHEYPRGPASQPLQELALAAGEYSRYRTDLRFPLPAFVRLYRIWIERSTKGEIADVVEVLSDRSGKMLGMVTIALEGQVGRIGLIAVDERARGGGLGKLLLRWAHHYMGHKGCSRSVVATQQDNLAACRLYEATGYRLADLKNVYHFWPLAS